MKRNLILALLLLFFMAALPLSVFILPNEEGDISATGDYSHNSSKIRVLLTEENKTITVSMDEYLIGALASEMTPLYHRSSKSTGSCLPNICRKNDRTAKGESF